MDSIWTRGFLDVETLPWIPAFCLTGILLSFWWLRLKIQRVVHSISYTAYESRVIFHEYCAFNLTFLVIFTVWELYNYALSGWDDVMLPIAIIGLAWLPRFWDYKGDHKWQHYGIAIPIFGSLAYWSGDFWWMVIILAAISFIASNKKYNILWMEGVMIHLIVFQRLWLYYIK